MSEREKVKKMTRLLALVVARLRNEITDKVAVSSSRIEIVLDEIVAHTITEIPE